MAEQRLIDAKDWDSFYADMGDSRNMMDSYDRGYTDALDRVDDWMDVQPTVDAVEVVRCKDCAFYRETEDWDGNNYYACHKRAAVLIMQMKPNDFCSYGERKDK